MCYYVLNKCGCSLHGVDFISFISYPNRTFIDNLEDFLTNQQNILQRPRLYDREDFITSGKMDLVLEGDIWETGSAIENEKGQDGFYDNANK